MKKLPEDAAKRLVGFYRTADKYAERLESHNESAYAEYVRFVSRYVTKKDRILDIGCGTGLSTFMLRQFAGEVYGLDISPIFIRIAQEKRRAENLSFQCADIMRLPFPDGQYDVVSSFLFIEHVCDVPQALSEMVRVTKKGGLIIILSPNLLSPFAELYKLADAVLGKQGTIRQNPLKSVWLAAYKTVLLTAKAISGKADFRYRLPILENRFDLVPDNDAAYLSNPVDLKHWFKANGLDVIKYQRETRWGRVFPSLATGIHIVAKK